jgi:hypothetical protein
MGQTSSRRTGFEVSVSQTIPLARYIHRDQDAALAALERVGGRVIGRLESAVMHPEIGSIRRYFAIFGNIYSDSSTAPAEIREPLEAILQEEDNDEIRVRLQRGKQLFTPMNKRMIRTLVGAFQGNRVHIPWCFRPMNYDLAARVQRVHRYYPFPFRVFYSQTVTFFPSKTSLHDGLVAPGRLFSLLVQGDVQGTWHQTIRDGMLDPDVALIIEANTA